MQEVKFVRQPQERGAVNKDLVKFSAMISGSVEPSFMWTLNGNAITGEQQDDNKHESTLSFSFEPEKHVGRYQCVALDKLSSTSVTSRDVELTGKYYNTYVIRTL